MTFNPLDEPVDYILLANQKSPGIAVVEAASSPRQWDERKGYALSGARVVFKGIGLARPIVTLRLLTTEDWDAWHQWRPLVQRPPVGVRARAQDIWHPILEDLGIVSVVVEDVSQPRQVADGEWNIEIKFIEFRRPVFTLETIGSSDTAEPQDEGEQLIEAWGNQNQVLAAELAALP
jgi:hypothetical protein